MKIKFYFDLKDWALPIRVNWNSHYFSLSFLCFDVTLFFPVKEVYQSPEEKLEHLNQYAEETVQFISDEREAIYKEIGFQTATHSNATVSFTWYVGNQ